MNIAVVTETEREGNLAVEFMAYQDDPYNKPNKAWSTYDINKPPEGVPVAMAYTEVFKVGEMLILNENDRDQFGRMPSKWDVKIEHFDNIEDAIKRVKEVTGE